MNRLFAILSLAIAASAAAQSNEPASTPLPRSLTLGGALYYGSPQGEFANNVDAAFGGAGFVGWRVGASPVLIRADLGFSIYGSETRRVPLGNGPLGLIRVDVNTSNNIGHGSIGLQLGAPGAGLRPYAGGSVGFAYFFTESSVSGSSQHTSEAFASTTNMSDATFAKSLFGGFYIPVGSSGGAIDVGVRYHWNGEAHYLTDDDIDFDANNNPVLSPRWSRADLLTIQVGFAFRRR